MVTIHSENREEAKSPFFACAYSLISLILKLSASILRLNEIIEEMKTLIDTGFDYVTDIQIGETPYKLFRKKKAWRPE